MLQLLVQAWLLLTVGFLALLLAVITAQKALSGVRAAVHRVRPALQQATQQATVPSYGTPRSG